MVIGDVILDSYHFGAPLADSEGGVVVGREKETRHSWGGAGLLVRNILELKQKVILISLLGNDAWSAYEKEWTHKNLTKCFVREKERHTTVKERFVVDGRKAFKWNTLDDRTLSRAAESRLYAYAEKYLARCRLLVVSDYRHGLLSKRLASQLVALARKKGVPVIVDSQVSQFSGNHAWYEGADMFCLNEDEARSVDSSFSDSDLAQSLRRLSATLKSASIVVKRGEHGSVALVSGAYLVSPVHPVDSIDPCGAGDAFLAALAAREFPPDEDALRFANFWAALSTTVVGAEPPKYVRH